MKNKITEKKRNDWMIEETRVKKEWLIKWKRNGERE